MKPEDGKGYTFHDIFSKFEMREAPLLFFAAHDKDESEGRTIGVIRYLHMDYDQLMVHGCASSPWVCVKPPFNSIVLNGRIETFEYMFRFCGTQDEFFACFEVEVGKVGEGIIALAWPLGYPWIDPGVSQLLANIKNQTT